MLAALFLLAASTPTSADGPDPTAVRLTMMARSSDPAAVSLAGEPTTTARVRLESIWLAFGDVRLRTARSCERTAPAPAVEGNFAVELVSGRVVGFPERFGTSAGRYCALSVGLRRGDASGDQLPAELRGASLVIRGRRSDGVAFTLRLRRTDRLRLQALEREGFALDGARTSLVLAADAARWFRGLNLDLAEPSGDQPAHVRIDERNNAALLEQFQRNLTPGFSLFRDRDDNGRLDADELKRPIASGRTAHGSERSPAPAADRRFVSASR